jgi:hypothetical protein
MKKGAGMFAGRFRRRSTLPVLAVLLSLTSPVRAAGAQAVPTGEVPFTDQADSAYVKKHIFPLWQEKVKGRKLPPPYGVMLITNWMNSDWDFQSAILNLGGSGVPIDAAEDATMNLEIGTTGLKADIWVLPMLNLFAGGGEVEVDAELGLRDIPLTLPPGVVHGDAIVPMEFDGSYYSLGLVGAYAYRHFYGAADVSWVKTSLSGSGASLSADGFWTFTAAPKIGYNAGLSQLYIGARYVSKNEHYTGTVLLPSGNDLGFDVHITTHSWAPNAGMRTVIHEHWEFLMEVAFDPRQQITAGAGYRW